MPPFTRTSSGVRLQKTSLKLSFLNNWIFWLQSKSCTRTFLLDRSEQFEPSFLRLIFLLHNLSRYLRPDLSAKHRSNASSIQGWSCHHQQNPMKPQQSEQKHSNSNQSHTKQKKTVWWPPKQKTDTHMVTPAKLLTASPTPRRWPQGVG